MYSYSGRGWKPTTTSSSSSSSCGVGQSSSVVTSTDRCYSKSILEDEDEVDLLQSEEKDVPAPLPTSSGTTKQLKTKNTSAKDKRRLREKRRSTGVASLAGHEVDEETVRNTSFNEVAVDASSSPSPSPAAEAAAATPEVYGEHHEPQSGKTVTDDAMTTQSLQQIPSHNGSVTQHKSKPTDQTSSHSLRIHDDAALLLSESTSSPDATPNSNHVTTTSSVFSKNLCGARPFEAKQRSILKGSCPSRPLVPAKPEAFIGAPSTDRRIAELEKLLECEKRENASMKQILSEKESRIRDLELQIANLNEDLDLADEDFMRLEEENRALGRALSGLNASSE